VAPNYYYYYYYYSGSNEVQPCRCCNRTLVLQGLVVVRQGLSFRHTEQDQVMFVVIASQGEVWRKMGSVTVTATETVTGKKLMRMVAEGLRPK
jgi:hypothetical protein